MPGRELAGDVAHDRRVTGPGEGAGVVDQQRQLAAGAGEVPLDAVPLGVLDAEAEVGGDGGPHDGSAPRRVTSSEVETEIVPAKRQVARGEVGPVSRGTSTTTSSRW